MKYIKYESNQQKEKLTRQLINYMLRESANLEKRCMFVHIVVDVEKNVQNLYLLMSFHSSVSVLFFVILFQKGKSSHYSWMEKWVKVKKIDN
jgi:hypothetical protein